MEENLTNNKFEIWYALEVENYQMFDWSMGETNEAWMN